MGWSAPAIPQPSSSGRALVSPGRRRRAQRLVSRPAVACRAKVWADAALHSTVPQHEDVDRAPRLESAGRPGRPGVPSRRRYILSRTSAVNERRDMLRAPARPGLLVLPTCRRQRLAAISACCAPATAGDALSGHHAGGETAISAYFCTRSASDLADPGQVASAPRHRGLRRFGCGGCRSLFMLAIIGLFWLPVRRRRSAIGVITDGSVMAVTLVRWCRSINRETVMQGTISTAATNRPRCGLDGRRRGDERRDRQTRQDLPFTLRPSSGDDTKRLAIAGGGMAGAGGHHRRPTAEPQPQGASTPARRRYAPCCASRGRLRDQEHSAAEVDASVPVQSGCSMPISRWLPSTTWREQLFMPDAAASGEEIYVRVQSDLDRSIPDTPDSFDAMPVNARFGVIVYYRRGLLIGGSRTTWPLRLRQHGAGYHQ